MQTNQKIERKFMGTKELITVTIFTLLLLAVRFVLEVLAGLHPLVYFGIAVLGAILSAPFFVLLLSKVQKVGALSIYSGFMMLFCGVKGWYESAIIYLVIGIASELIRYALQRNVKLATIVTYTVFCLGNVGVLVPYVTRGDSVAQSMVEFGMPQDYVDLFMGLFSPASLAIMVVVTIASALFMGLFSFTVLKKQFVKAGLLQDAGSQSLDQFE